MYSSATTPTGLAYTFQYDVRLYFCIENMYTITNLRFQLKQRTRQDSKAKDELTKDKKEENKDLVSGVMPESLGECIIIKNDVRKN